MHHDKGNHAVRGTAVRSFRHLVCARTSRPHPRSPTRFGCFQRCRQSAGRLFELGAPAPCRLESAGRVGFLRLFVFRHRVIDDDHPSAEAPVSVSVRARAGILETPGRNAATRFPLLIAEWSSPCCRTDRGTETSTPSSTGRTMVDAGLLTPGNVSMRRTHLLFEARWTLAPWWSTYCRSATS